MIKIAICDDEQLEIDSLLSMLNVYDNNNPLHLIDVTSFSNPIELLNHVMKNGEFDIYLLDIYMDIMLGTDLAKRLRELGGSGEIIFTTTSLDHAVDAYELEAAQYLVKPYSRDYLFLALDKVIENIKLKNNKSVKLKSSDGMIRIFVRDFVYSESNKNNYQTIYTIKDEKYVVRITTSDLYDLLSENKNIIKVGAALIINLRYVRQIKKDVIVFDNGSKVGFPYRSYKQLKAEFFGFQLGSLK